jgi:H+/Cl- antiporter ClcA
MSRRDKVSLLVLGTIFVVCAVALFLPPVQNGEITRGALRGFQMPAWLAIVVLMLLCVAAVVIMFANRARQRRGKGPL